MLGSIFWGNMIGNILFVDDNIDFLDLMRAEFSEDIALDCAGDQETALKLISEKEYKIIFIDGHIGKTIGFELCKTIRKLQIKQPRIVLLTGEIEDDTEFKTLDAGADYLMCKPFARREFIALVKNFSERR